jgi:heme exporter protein D
MHANISHMLEMGGYAKYVWTAYGITLFVFGINIVISLREKKQIKKIVQHYLSRHES